MAKYDLRERTYSFALRIMEITKMIMKNYEIREIGKQLLRSGISIGANTEEADGARTGKEFISKMTIARNEAKETRYWLRLMIDSKNVHNAENMAKMKELLKECEELIKIISSIVK